MWYPGLSPEGCSWWKCRALWLRAKGRRPAGSWGLAALADESWEMMKIRELEAWLETQHSFHGVRAR